MSLVLRRIGRVASYAAAIGLFSPAARRHPLQCDLSHLVEAGHGWDNMVIGLFCGAVLLHAQDPWVYRDHPRWERSWNQRPVPRSGVCFYKDVGFQGDRFCVSRGDRLESLPGDFGDKISSLRLFGDASVTVFNDRNFRGGSQEFRRSISDLRTQRFRDGHTWNDRISSMAVR